MKARIIKVKIHQGYRYEIEIWRWYWPFWTIIITFNLI